MVPRAGYEPRGIIGSTSMLLLVRRREICHSAFALCYRALVLRAVLVLAS
jgi:hypothetical protein